MNFVCLLKDADLVNLSLPHSFLVHLPPHTWLRHFKKCWLLQLFSLRLLFCIYPRCSIISFDIYSWLSFWIFWRIYLYSCLCCRRVSKSWKLVPHLLHNKIFPCSLVIWSSSSFNCLTFTVQFCAVHWNLDFFRNVKCFSSICFFKLLESL